jgi:hypothetical protein
MPSSEIYLVHRRSFDMTDNLMYEDETMICGTVTKTVREKKAEVPPAFHWKRESPLHAELNYLEHVQMKLQGRICAHKL